MEALLGILNIGFPFLDGDDVVRVLDIGADYLLSQTEVSMALVVLEEQKNDPLVGFGFFGYVILDLDLDLLVVVGVLPGLLGVVVVGLGDARQEDSD